MRESDKMCTVRTTGVVSMVELRQTQTDPGCTQTVGHWTDSSGQTRWIQLTFWHYSQHQQDKTHINKLCAWRHIMPPPRQVDNIFAFIRQVAPVPACWRFKTSATSDLWPFDLESGVRVTCDVGYLCANFSLPVLDLGPMYAEALSDAFVWRMSRSSGLSREQRGQGRLKFAQR